MRPDCNIHESFWVLEDGDCVLEGVPTMLMPRAERGPPIRSSALDATNRIARCLCDVHAVTQHWVVSPLGWEQAGRALSWARDGRPLGG